MNGKLKIAIPGRESDVVNYVRVIKELGADPQVHSSSFSCREYDALILPGGDDISPSRYGEPNIGCRKLDPEMEALQFDTLDTFMASGKPVLGICNGMQMINIWFGGSLIQNLEMNYRHQTNNGVASYHASSIPEDSWLYPLYGSSAFINSSHHQGVKQLGKGLMIQQLSDDGVIESICHESLPVHGVQWHPERMSPAMNAANETASAGGAVNGWKVYQWFLDSIS